MLVEIDSDTADNVVCKTLSLMYDEMKDELVEVIREPENVIGVYSFNPEKEAFEIIETLKALERVLSLFDSYTVRNVDITLEEHNSEIFKRVIDYQTLKEEKEHLIIKSAIIQEELDELKQKVSALIK